MCIILIAGTTGLRISAVYSSQLNQQNPSSVVFVTGYHPCLSTTPDTVIAQQSVSSCWQVRWLPPVVPFAEAVALVFG
jgi:hypothetical protein